jgi:hypothetical protein
MKAFIFGLLSGVIILIVTIIVINVVFLQTTRNITISKFQMPIDFGGNQGVSLTHISWVSSFRRRNVLISDYIKNDSYLLSDLGPKDVRSSYSTRYPKGMDQIREVVSMFERGAIQANDNGGRFVGILTKDQSKILIPEQIP